MRTLWLADHLLVSERGHHVSYNGFIADSARRAGMEVRILCARDCERASSRRLRDARNFPQRLAEQPVAACSHARVLALDVLETLARRRFESDLLTGITPDEIQRHDIIFAEMLAPRNLAGWLRWLRSFSERARADPRASCRLCLGAFWSRQGNSGPARIARTIGETSRERTSQRTATSSRKNIRRSFDDR